MSNKEYRAYLCFLKPKPDEPVMQLMISSDTDAIQKWKELDRDDRKRRSIEGSEQQGANAQAAETADVTKKLGLLMSRFRQAISGYQVLSDSSMMMLPATRFIYMTKELMPDVKKHLNKFEEDEKYVTYGVSAGMMPMLKRHTDRMDEIDQAAKVLPGAILLSLVATFDSLIVDILSTMLKSRPDRVAKSDRKLSVAQILSMSSFEEVTARVIADEISAIMRGSHREQIEFIEDTFNIKFPRSHDHWGNFIEIFERRNLVAHGDLFVNHIYYENCKAAGVDLTDRQIGKRLSLSRSYISNSADTLIEFGIEIIALLWKQNFPEKLEDAFGTVNTICFDLLRNERAVLATRLLEFSLTRQKPKISERLFRMMIVNLANAYKIKGDEKREKEILSSVDWSAASAEFKICIASLDKDVDEVLRLLPQVMNDGSIDSGDLREWPIFRWVRSDEKFSARFREIFGEDLVPNNPEIYTGDRPQPATDESSPNDETVH